MVRTLIFFCCVLSFLAMPVVYASSADPVPPPVLGDLENLPKLNVVVDHDTGMPFDIRMNALREAALSYGARGGLARRTFEIRQELEHRASYMDRIYDFRQLLITAPSGLLIEPPVISEQIDALLINSDGLSAAVADRIYNISAQARIVSAARDWRNYLERDWGEITPPPDILRPNDDKERAVWREYVRKGWEEGVKQADEIFQEDLNQLLADYRGMVRYRMLLAQGMVSQPHALHVDRGITGGGNEMRIGDRSVQMTGLPELIPGFDQWQPANR